MSIDSFAKYYQKNKERLLESLGKKVFRKKKKKKHHNMGVNDIKISLKIKNKS